MDNEKPNEDTPLIGQPITMITPKSGWRFFDYKELVEYRDLFFFLAWRNIQVLYAQTILGFFWALLVPAIQILIFTIVWGKLPEFLQTAFPTSFIPQSL